MQHTRGPASGKLADHEVHFVPEASRSVGNVADRAHFRPRADRWGSVRRARLPRLLATAVALVAAVTLFAGCFGTQGQYDAFIAMNSDRSAHEVGPLIPHGELIAKAQAWADHLAAENSLSHSTLSDGVPGCWQALGENVGYGSSIGGVEDAFMGSTDHRTNLLNGAYDYAGTGVATNGSRVFVVQVFMQGC
jgi:uncharacterized protein YkwD